MDVLMSGILFSVSFLNLIISSFALRMKMMEVPSPAVSGQSVELTCHYELDNDSLYSIKWYKDDIEFFRYVTNDWPPGQFLPLPGVRVDLSKSGATCVYLRSIDLNSTGLYRCEVSAESPSFQTVEAEMKMNVIVLPAEGPRISGGKTKYDVGDMVDLNCSSAKSKPAANLQWYINSEPVPPDYTEYSTVLHSDGLESSSLSLRFVAQPKHFRDQSMKLKCTASITPGYTMSDEEMATGGRQQTSQLQVNEDVEQSLSIPSGKPLESVKSSVTNPATSTTTTNGAEQKIRPLFISQWILASIPIMLLLCSG